MLITRKSPISGKVNIQDIPVSVEQLERFSTGIEHIQNICPELSPDQREFLISGITAQEWEDTFGDNNEE